MKEILENGRIRLYPSDWRYSASIVGLCYFSEKFGKDFNIEQFEDYIEYDNLEENFELFKEKYLLFAEDFFAEFMHHKTVEKLLEKEELSPEEEKKVEKLIKNSVMKSIFGSIKYSKENVAQIKKLINENRLTLIEKTFATGANLYAKFGQTEKGISKLLTKEGKVCRLHGYYEDTTKKLKSLTFNFNKNTFVFKDEFEFDFIPFAFSKSNKDFFIKNHITEESFFINNNITIEELVRTQKNFKDKLDDVQKSINEKSVKKFFPRQLLFLYQNSITNLDYNVEIVSKTSDKKYFKTIYVRDRALQIFKEIKHNDDKNDEKSCEVIARPCKYGDDWLDIQKHVTDCVLNNIFLDDLILKLFNQKIDKQSKKLQDHSYLQWHLIKINSLIYGGDKMNQKIRIAMATASNVKQKLDENKLKSYRQKLISAITFNDYDRFCKILLQLSDYSGIIFDFAYDLFDDFEANKNVAFAFVNGLNNSNENNENKKDGGKE